MNINVNGIRIKHYQSVEYLMTHGNRDHSGYGLSQSDVLLCNAISHWLRPYLEWTFQAQEAHTVQGNSHT